MARIMIVVDHKWRDLPNCVYLKLLLENKYQHTVELVRLGEDSALMSSFRPHMVVYNNLYEKDRNAYARYLKLHGIKIVILPTEGITFSDQQTVLFTHKYSGIEFIDLYLAWNRLIYDAILEHNVLPESKVCLVGNSRFDFYLPPLSSLLKDREYFQQKYGISSDRFNLSIITNYANAEFWPDTSFLEKNLAKQRASGIPVFSDAAKLAKYEYDYRNKMFELIVELSRRQNNINLLLKYHPSERKAVYHQFADKLRSFNKNVFLIEGEYIWDVLNVSDLVLQRCSTVAMESWMLGKQTVEVELMPLLDHFLQPRYREGSWCVNSVEQLLDVISIISHGGYFVPPKIQEAREKILKYLVFQPDGRTTERIAAIMDNVVRQGSNYLSRVRAFNFKNRLKSIARITLGMKGYDRLSNLARLKFGDYLGRYEKRFSATDIVKWMKILTPYC